MYWKRKEASMYDTVKFCLRCWESEKKSLLSQFDFQKDTKVRYECWSYQLDNLIIKVYDSSITIEGSLAKFYYKNNFYLLGREDIKQAIDLLSGILRLDINSAHVTRIDTAADFEMYHNTKKYLPFLGNYSRHKRELYKGTTLYYISKSHTCAFYDKGKELQGKEGAESCLLRFESRWLNSLSTQLNWKDITGETLSVPHFYRYIIQLWGKKYFDIKKRNVLIIDPTISINTAKKAMEYLLNAFLYSSSLSSSSEKFIKETKMFLIEQLDTQNRSRFNRMLNKLNEDFSINKRSPLMEELDCKIRDRITLECGIL
ncbi:phage/plasmid replication domain-containing protein [Parabacteroides sp.]